jgi:hypothetical protein
MRKRAIKIETRKAACGLIPPGILSTKNVTAICSPRFRATPAPSKEDQTRQYRANSSVQKRGSMRAYLNSTSTKTTQAITEIITNRAISANLLIIVLVRSIVDFLTGGG